MTLPLPSRDLFEGPIDHLLDGLYTKEPIFNTRTYFQLLGNPKGRPVFAQLPDPWPSALCV
jgi:hypothetical protein